MAGSGRRGWLIPLAAMIASIMELVASLSASSSPSATIPITPAIAPRHPQAPSIAANPVAAIPASIVVAASAQAHFDAGTQTRPCLGFEHIFIALLLLSLILLTIVGNVLVVLSVFLYKRMRTFTNFLLTSLATADLLVGLLIMPLSLIDLLHSHRWPFGRLLCRIWATMDVLLCTASILNLCIISLDRYMAITSPLKYPRTRNRRMAALRLLLVWGISVVVCSPPWFIPEWGLFFHQEGSAGSPRGQPLVCAYPTSKAYRLYSASVSFYIPLAVMLFVYYKIFRVASQREMLMRANMGGTCRLSRRLEKQQRAAALNKKNYLHVAANNCHLRCSSAPIQRVKDLDGTNLVADGGVPSNHPSQATTNSLQLSHNGANCTAVDPKQPTSYRRPSHCPAPIMLHRSETTDDYSPLERDSSSAAIAAACAASPRGAEPTIVVDMCHGGGQPADCTREAHLSAVVLSRRGMSRESRSLLNLADDRCVMDANGRRKLTDTSLPHSPVIERTPLKGSKKRASHWSQPQLNVASARRLVPPPKPARQSAGAIHAASNHPTATMRTDRCSIGSIAAAANLVAKAQQHYQVNGPGKALRGSKEKIVYMRERKALKTIGIVVLGFIICWMPFFVVYLLEVFISGLGHIYGFQLMNEFFLWLGYSNSVLNPLIYTMYNGDFRRCFRDLMACGCLQTHRRTMSVKKLHQQSTAF